MTRTIEATAWTLIHFCWQAAVIAGLYRMKVRYRFRYWRPSLDRFCGRGAAAQKYRKQENREGEMKNLE